MNMCHHLWLFRWVLRVKVRFSYAKHPGGEGRGEREVENRREERGEEREEGRRKRGAEREIMNKLT